MCLVTCVSKKESLKPMRLKTRAQSTIEFTFTMIIVLLLVYGLVRVFRWTALDLADRRIAHETVLEDNRLSTRLQVDPNFSRPRKIHGIFHGFNLIQE